ncbi:hypothetical protein ZWY2020_015966 [Hordeum vulgare]|nr:hypothetical protein ZWY2020_015966 [Hordeum vulgare]
MPPPSLADQLATSGRCSPCPWRLASLDEKLRPRQATQAQVVPAPPLPEASRDEAGERRLGEIIRVDVVFERFVGNASAALFAATHGYVLAPPVAALLAYDVSAGNNGSRAVSLRALGAPVCVDFGDLASAAAATNGTPPFNAMAARCMTF